MVLDQTWQTHKLWLLNARRQRQNVSSASAGLSATILAACVASSRGKVFSFGRNSLMTLIAQVLELRGTTYNRANETGGFVRMTNLAKHMVWCAAFPMFDRTLRHIKIGIFTF
ncbi:MAG TPA: hypothetical protein VNX46_04140 [Candidatus Acidoferrum sp.]|nr:hypothetical protein [Candidatus Acidoferrum sp.]